MTCYLADYPLRGENKKCLSAEAEPCESVLSLILVAEPNRSTAEAEETYVATTTWTRPTTWVAMVEARARRWTAASTASCKWWWIPTWIGFRTDLQLGSCRRPIGRIAAGWSCSAGSVYDVARRLLWKEHTW